MPHRKLVRLIVLVSSPVILCLLTLWFGVSTKFIQPKPTLPHYPLSNKTLRQVEADDFVIALNDYYWYRWDPYVTISLFPLKMEQRVNEILILTLALTNNSSTNANFDCHVVDALGRLYSHSPGSLTPRDEYLFMRSLTAGTTQLGNEEYWFLPNDGQSLTLDCYITEELWRSEPIHLALSINSE